MGNKQAHGTSSTAAAAPQQSAKRRWPRRKCVGPAPVEAPAADASRHFELVAKGRSTPLSAEQPKPPILESPPSPPLTPTQLPAPSQPYFHPTSYPPPEPLQPSLPPPPLPPPPPPPPPEPQPVINNDDHLFPDAVTPVKVDRHLAESYDVPYIDDDAFSLCSDDDVEAGEAHYFTEDLRWSLILTAACPRLAECEEFPEWAPSINAVNHAELTNSKTGERPCKRQFSLLGLLRSGRDSVGNEMKHTM